MTRILIGDEQWEGLDIGDLAPYGELVFTGPHAAERMRHIRSRGIEPGRLSWLDGDKVRDFMWGPYRWADDLPSPPDDKYLDCGIDGLGKRVNWRLPELVIVAGPYASGKSLFTQILAQDFVNRNDQWASLTCWEDQYDEICDGLVRYRESTCVSEHRKADFLKRFRIAIVDDDSDRKISEHFDRIEFEARDLGIKFHVLDPWNEFDNQKAQKQTEGEYVISVLTTAAKLCNKLKIIIIITTHVAAEFISHGNELKTFRLSNSFGTSQFGNKAHRGFCIARTRMWDPLSHMIIRQDKVKLEDKVIRDSDGKIQVLKRRMGYPDTMAFTFNPTINTLGHCGETSKKAREKWK